MDNKITKILSKVPEVTLIFWIIKVMWTTVWETSADFLNFNMGFWLTTTSIAMGILFLIALFVQFRYKKYVPWIYWLNVILISIVWTLITDNLTDHFWIPLIVTTIVFSIALIITFIVWYMKEKTLSIHSIFTRKREIFYWLAILFTFALGTASGDLVTEQFRLGYFLWIILFWWLIAVIGFGYYRFKWNAVLSFWLVYILTRPLGASLGDFLTQTKTVWGLWLSNSMVNIVFFLIIISGVAYLSFQQRKNLDKVV